MKSNIPETFSIDILSSKNSSIYISKVKSEKTFKILKLS